MKFGDKVVNSAASPNNPIKYGFFVKTVYRTGRLNPGKYYQLTDGKGHFWEVDYDCISLVEEAKHE